MVQPGVRQIPTAYIEQSPLEGVAQGDIARTSSPTISAERARTTFDEVELALPQKAAQVEARRCLRCDLEFTQPANEETPRKQGASA